jgi:HPt (histidine-containing phosphotransfer) domain-containing protein
MRHYVSKAIPGFVACPERNESETYSVKRGSRWLSAVFDSHLLLERIDYDQETARELLALFLLELDEVMDCLTVERLQDDSPETVMRQAHKLKGMCRDVGAEPLAALAAMVESQAEKGALREPKALARALLMAQGQLRAEIHSWLTV